jgi:hypothetical protein
MSGPNRTSTIPPVTLEDGPKKSDDIRKISNFIVAHITCTRGRDLPGYSLDLGKDSKLYVMREYLSGKNTGHGADLYVSDPYDFDILDDLEDTISKHDFLSQELIVACNANEEIMHLHITKNKPSSSLDSDVSLRAKTRSRVLRNISDPDSNN